MKRMSGLIVLDEREGEESPAKKGDRVVYNTRIFLIDFPEFILSKAVLIADIWLRAIAQERKVPAS